MRRAGLLLCFLLLPMQSPRADEQAVNLEALVNDEALAEISGLALSPRHPGVIWMHNDGDNASELHAVDAGGARLATLRLDGVRNIDWEDMAAFEWRGRSWLMVADVGDNGGLRRELSLLVVEEPAQLQDATVPIAWTQEFRWPDGARDCEAMAVDATEGWVYLVSKKRVPPELFRLPLGAGDGSVQTAQRLGTLAGIEQPSAADISRNPVYGRYRAQITAADISADGRMFAVLNYRRVYVWTRSGESWIEAVAEPPRVRDFPWIPQAEALGFERDGSALWISSERLPAPLLRVNLLPASEPAHRQEE